MECQSKIFKCFGDETQNIGIAGNFFVHGNSPYHAACGRQGIAPAPRQACGSRHRAQHCGKQLGPAY